MGCWCLWKERPGWTEDMSPSVPPHQLMCTHGRCSLLPQQDAFVVPLLSACGQGAGNMGQPSTLSHGPLAALHTSTPQTIISTGTSDCHPTSLFRLFQRPLPLWASSGGGKRAPHQHRPVHRANTSCEH